MNTVLLALARPAAICLVAGGLRFLQDYQLNGKALPALVDGGIVALEAAGGWVGVAGVASGVNTVRTKPVASQG